MRENTLTKEEEKRHWRSHIDKAEEILGYANKTMPLRQGRRLGMLVKMAGIKEGKRILEIGCGAGNYTRELAKTKADIIAVDLSVELLDLAGRKPLANVEYKQADIECLPFEDGYFDAVVGNSVLHHCDIHRVLKEIGRVLKKNGKAAFSEPNMLNPHVFLQKNVKFLKRLAGDSPGETAFFRWQLKNAFLQEGFTGIIVRPFDFLYPLIPSFAIGIVNKFGVFLENIPIIKEFAGSLIISATLNEGCKDG